MVKTAGALHSDPAHDRCRANVVMHREGNDLVQLQCLEAMAEQRGCCFGDVALAPVALRQAPADLDCT
jgi:hypothetical protein